jgi:hypothetical protein
VDEFAEAAVIGADAIERIEVGLAGAAQTATPIKIENRFAMKGGVALDTEGFRGERGRGGQAGRTDRVGRETG